MATSQEEDQNPNIEEEDEGDEEESDENGNGGGGGGGGGEGEDDDHDEEEEDEEDEGEDEVEADGGGGNLASKRAKLNTLFQRLSRGPVAIRVHDVVIKGNAKTKDALIEAEVVGAFRSASTMQELVAAAQIATERLHKLDIFESASIVLNRGPAELPGTANVVIEVVEAKSPLIGDIGVYTKPGARAWSLEGSLKWKNVLGYGDIWDASGAFGGDQTTELGAGLSLPRFKAIPTPLMARLSLLSQDWLKFSSYKESTLGLSFGLLSTIRHDLAYNLTWRTLTDPSRMASPSVRRQLGHSLLSSMKYTYKIDQRNSLLRPTSGYAFLSTCQVGGLGPDSKSLRFIRQEFDIRGAIPLGFFNSALNVGVAAGLIVPMGRGLMNGPSALPERFFMGGSSSPVVTLGGVGSVLGFKLRGFGPTDLRRLVLSSKGEGDDDTQESRGRDALGGDLAVAAFADLSFDLPLKLFRESGIHGHAFVTAGNLTALAGAEYKNFSIRGFCQRFRSSAGAGFVVPTKFFRMEINYCYILKQLEHDRGKTGIQFSFSSPL